MTVNQRTAPAVGNTGKSTAEFSEVARSPSDSDLQSPWHKLTVPALPLVLALSGVFLYLQLFIAPAIPRVAIGDQSIYLHSAVRMYEGQTIYRDYDQFTFAGTDVLYFVLFELFGVKAWIPQMMLVLAGVLSVWLSIFIASKILRGTAVYLPPLLFLMLPYSSYPDATHHLYSTLAATLALAVVIEKRTPMRVACGGLFWGIATCFAQSLILGPLCLAVFLIWEHRRNAQTWSRLFKAQAWLWAFYGATVFAFNGYFVWKTGLRKFAYYTGFFVLKYVPTYKIGGWSTYLRGWPSSHKIANWPDLLAWPLIHGLVPLIYAVFLLVYWGRIRRERSESWSRLVLINVTGISLFLTIASAPAWNRLYTISMPALLMLVWFASSHASLGRFVRRSLWRILLVLAIVRPIVTQIRWRAVLDLPTGRTAFLDRGLYEETKWLQHRTRPGDYFFGNQLLCFDLRLRNPSRVAYVTPFAFTTTDEVTDLMRSLDAHQVRFVSWYVGLDDPSAIEGNNLGPLRRYLAEHYHVVQRFSNGHSFLERNIV